MYDPMKVSVSERSRKKIFWKDNIWKFRKKNIGATASCTQLRAIDLATSMDNHNVLINHIHKFSTMTRSYAYKRQEVAPKRVNLKKKNILG